MVATGAIDAQPTLTKNPRPRRIVVLAPHFAEYATRLALALAHDADVLLIREEKNAAAECSGLSFELSGIELAQFNLDYVLRTFSLRGQRETRAVVAAIERFQPDVIHMQEQGDRFTRKIAERFAPACPVILTVHDPVPHSGQDTAVATIFAANLQRLRAVASGYHVHGAYCEARLRDTLATMKPIVSTAHGIMLVPPDIKPLGSQFLFFGRMEAYKGIETLLDAVDLIPRQFGLKIVFAGRGPELEKHRVRVMDHPAIILQETFLTPVAAIAAFQQARAVLVPYRDATQSGVVSAAIGNGRPVIATRVGGLIDAVMDDTTGLLVPPEDPRRLAAAMQTLSDDLVAERLASGARAAASGQFAWTTIAREMHALYAKVRAS